jgi:hypothetical protein
MLGILKITITTNVGPYHLVDGPVTAPTDANNASASPIYVLCGVKLGE